MQFLLNKLREKLQKAKVRVPCCLFCALLSSKGGHKETMGWGWLCRRFVHSHSSRHFAIHAQVELMVLEGKLRVMQGPAAAPRDLDGVDKRLQIGPSVSV